MADTKELISSLDSKIGLLIEKVKTCSAALQAKNREVEQLKKQVTVLENQTVELRSENQQLKSAPVFKEEVLAVEEDTEETKVRISELVKEIDTCISMLKL